MVGKISEDNARQNDHTQKQKWKRKFNHQAKVTVRSISHHLFLLLSRTVIKVALANYVMRENEKWISGRILIRRDWVISIYVSFPVFHCTLAFCKQAKSARDTAPLNPWSSGTGPEETGTCRPVIAAGLTNIPQVLEIQYYGGKKKCGGWGVLV